MLVIASALRTTMQLATVAVMRIDFLKASLSSNAEQNANRTIAHTSAAFYRSGQ
jgi:hypothetical protein